MFLLKNYSLIQTLLKSLPSGWELAYHIKPRRCKISDRIFRADRPFPIPQGLPDHAHKPTMELLPKDKPLVCSPAAAKIAAEMGFKDVYELDHGKSMNFANGQLNVRATVGKLKYQLPIEQVLVKKAKLGQAGQSVGMQIYRVSIAFSSGLLCVHKVKDCG